MSCYFLEIDLTIAHFKGKKYFGVKEKNYLDENLLMIKLLQFFVCFLVPIQAYSFVNVDSLVQVIDVLDGEEKAETYLKLTRAFQRTDLQQSQFYAKKGLTISSEMTLQKLEANFLLNLGIINTKKSNYLTAEEYYKKSIAVFRLLDNAKSVGYCYNNLGLNNEKQGNYKEAKHQYRQAQTVFELLNDTSTVLLIKANEANIDYLQGDFDAALTTYSEMLEMAKNSNKHILIARSFANMGRVYSKKGDYPMALNHYYRGLEITEKNNFQKENATALNSIGLLFSNFKMNKEAINSYQKALIIFESMGSKKGMGMVHNNLASRYLAQDSLLKAEFHIEKALNLYEEIGVKSNGNLLLNLANLQIEKKQLKIAEETIIKGIDVAQDKNQEGILAECYSILGKLYLQTKEYKKAEKYLTNAEISFEKIGRLNGLHTVVERLIEYYKIVDDSQKSIFYHEKNNILRDSIYGLDKTKKITRLELERQRNQFVKSVSSNQKNKENTIPQWLLIFLPIMIGGVLFIFYRKKKYQKKLEEKLNLANAETENIKDSLKQKNLEMTFLSLDLSRKDDFLKRVKLKLESVAKQNPANKDIVKLLHSVQIQDTNIAAWDQFKQAYEQVFPNFFDHLISDYPNLSTKELRHCALIRLKIPIQEVAEIIGVSTNSIHKARHRLRTKFSMTRNDNLEKFISKYGL